MADNDLISRLSALTGASREVDAELWEHFGMVDETHCKCWCSMDGRTDLTRERFIQAWAPEFTKSINAALTLLPKESAWELGCGFLKEFRAELLIGSNTIVGLGMTPAIALVIACLKAKG